MGSQLHKTLSLGASLVLIASPSFAQVPPSVAKATLYGEIVGSSGATLSGSVGIQSSRRTGVGHYCIKPISTTLQQDLQYDVAHGTGLVGVQLTPSSTSWPVVGKFVAQITGSNEPNNCYNYEIAVSVVQQDGCTPAPTGTASAGTCFDGFQSENSDFTVMFW
jgi:hypothetical protein